jgi:hypothetical protein
MTKSRFAALTKFLANHTCDEEACGPCNFAKSELVAAESLAQRVERLFDLVRYKRSELHTDGLISDDEYAWLVQADGHSKESVKRLETYDEQAKRIGELETINIDWDKTWRQYYENAMTCGHPARFSTHDICLVCVLEASKSIEAHQNWQAGEDRRDRALLAAKGKGVGE